MRRSVPSGRIHPEELAPVGPRRPIGGSVFEMHAHSSERSLDSGVRALELARQAAWRRLDGMCLTEHNALWPARELRELGERCEIVILAGMELGTDVGHVLVYGLDRYHPELLVVERLRKIVEREGAAMVLAHPMRPFSGRQVDWGELPDLFDGLEVINGDHGDSEESYLSRHAQAVGLAAIAGSDAHTRDAVGRVATVFRKPVVEVGEVARLIKQRKTVPVDFRPRNMT